jgi:hypothetical protein
VNQLVAQAAAVQRFCDSHGWRSCIIGGIAVIRWGEPRLTRDVGVSLFAGFGREHEYARAILDVLPPRIDGALAFAVANRVLLVRAADGIPVDIALAGFPFEQEIIDRASLHEYLPGIELRIVSAEDLIVLKAFANRPRDWADIAGIAARQRTLDWETISQRLDPLVVLKGEPEILQTLLRIRNES